MIDWSRLLIRTNRADTPQLLDCWEWLIGRDKHPLVMTKFGDWFLADPERRVHWLDLLEGTCTQVADSVAAFEQLMVQEEELDLWFMLPLCYRLHDDGQIPGDDQCFGFKIPPKLGAPVDLSNVEVANLMAYQVWMAEIAKILPGTKVDAITINGKPP
jgi:hypothetical protein